MTPMIARGRPFSHANPPTAPVITPMRPGPILHTNVVPPQVSSYEPPQMRMSPLPGSVADRATLGIPAEEIHFPQHSSSGHRVPHIVHHSYYTPQRQGQHLHGPMRSHLIGPPPAYGLYSQMVVQQSSRTKSAVSFNLTFDLAITIAPYLEVDMMIPPERFAEYPQFPVAVAFPPPAYPIIPSGAIPPESLTLLTIPSNMHPAMMTPAQSEGATTTKIEENSITFEFTVSILLASFSLILYSLPVLTTLPGKKEVTDVRFVSASTNSKTKCGDWRVSISSTRIVLTSGFTKHPSARYVVSTFRRLKVLFDKADARHRQVLLRLQSNENYS